MYKSYDLHKLTVKTSAQNFLGSSCKHSTGLVFVLSLLLVQLHPHILLIFSGLPFLLCLFYHSVNPSSTIPGFRFTTKSHLPTALSSLPFFSCLGLHLLWDGETFLSDTGLIVSSSVPRFLSIKAWYVTRSLPGTQNPIWSRLILHWLKTKKTEQQWVFFFIFHILYEEIYYIAELLQLSRDMFRPKPPTEKRCVQLGKWGLALLAACTQTTMGTIFYWRYILLAYWRFTVYVSAHLTMGIPVEKGEF